MQCELAPTITLVKPGLRNAIFKLEIGSVNIEFEISTDLTKSDWVTFAQCIKNKINRTLVHQIVFIGKLLVRYVSKEGLIYVQACYRGNTYGGDITFKVLSDCFLPAIEQNIREALDDNDK